MFAFRFAAIGPFWQRYSKFHIWPWKLKVKVMAKVKSYGHIWGLKFNRYVCFLFHGNRTIFGRDIVNFIFDLENSRSRSQPRSDGHIWGLELVAFSRDCTVLGLQDSQWGSLDSKHINEEFRPTWCSCDMKTLSQLLAFCEENPTGNEELWCPLCC